MHFMSPYVLSKQEETLMACPPQTVCRLKHRTTSAATTPSSQQFLSNTRIPKAVISHQSESTRLHSELSKLFEYIIRRRKTSTISSDGVLHRKLWRKFVRLQRYAGSRPNNSTANSTVSDGYAAGDSSKSFSELLRWWRLFDQQQHILSNDISPNELQFGLRQQSIEQCEVHRPIQKDVSGALRYVERESNCDFTTGCGESTSGRRTWRCSNSFDGSEEFNGLCTCTERTDNGTRTKRYCLSLMGLVRLEMFFRIKTRASMSKRKRSSLRLLQSKSLESSYITR